MTNGGLDPELRAALGRIARVPQLLVGCDYDGTLAPLVDDPAAAGPLPEAVAAVRALAALPQTVGRGDLGPRAARPGHALPPAERGAPGRQPRLRVRPRLRPAARARAPRAPRPAARRAAGDLARASRDPARDQAGEHRRAHARGRPGASASRRLEAVRTGPAIVARRLRDARQGGRSSCRSSPPTRAPPSTALRTQASASAVLYLGDDVTDENAFAQLHGPDVGIKIGAGETLAGVPRRRADRRGAGARLPARDAPALALRRARGADRAALDARQRLAPSPCSPRTPRSPGCATPGRTRRRSSPTCSAAPGRATSRSPRSARASRSASATGRAR